MRGVLVALTLAVALTAPVLAARQERPLREVLAADLLGPDWVLQDAGRPEGFDAPGVFVDAAYATYGGPGGARVLLRVYRVEPTLSSFGRAWERVEETFEETRRATEIDTAAVAAAAQTLPAGCAYGRHGEGNDGIGGPAFPVGLTLCAADPDLMILVYASGMVAGATGWAASDAVAARVLAAVGAVAPGRAGAAPVPPATPSPSFTFASVDIAFEPAELTIPANQDVTVRLPNQGAAPHSFVIPALGINVQLAPGTEERTTINADAGGYEYSCDVPGHK